MKTIKYKNLTERGQVAVTPTESSWDTDACPECGARDLVLDEERGERICPQCGTVIDHHIINHESGRRAFTHEERQARKHTGPPISPLLPDYGMRTMINRNAKNMSALLRRAAKWNTRMKWPKRNLLIATTDLKRIGSNLALPKYVLELAVTIYRKAVARKLLQGRSIKAMVAAVLYYACRKRKIPRTFQEIINESTANRHDVRRAYRSVVRELALRVPAFDPRIYVGRYVSELNLSRGVENKALALLQLYRENYPVGGKNPRGIIAAVIYAACIHQGEHRTQNEIGKVTDVTEVTIRARYKELKRVLKRYG